MMSNPSRPLEPWMNTETVSCAPWVPVIAAGPVGQGLVPDATMHTTPTPELETKTMTVVVRDRLPLVPVTATV